VRVLAIFGPTAVGKTGVAIEVGGLLRARGEDPVAISCDAIQVYDGLEILSGAATGTERERLEHRMLGIVPIDGEFSAGRFANLVHPEIDQLLAEARRPILVGGTGLYMRAALSELELRPPVPTEVRAEVEREIAERGAAQLHGELSPELASGVHPNDRKRIARLTELTRLGIAPHASAEQLWSEDLRVPATLIGITVDREELGRRVEARVDELVRRGALEEVHAADAAGASRTARAAIGFEELLAGDIEEMKRAQLRYARRQLTWMRRMEGVTRIDRGGRSDHEVAQEVFALLDHEEGGE
jgi:tRNA dimethylallyltransferase